jgi:hypothetical protein
MLAVPTMAARTKGHRDDFLTQLSGQATEAVGSSEEILRNE